MILAFVTAAVAVGSPAAAISVTEVEAAMTASAAGWNAGSLERFVAVYAADATFVGRDGLVHGRAAIAARYRPSFAAGGNSRGALSFQTLGHRMISKTHVLLFARWRLQPADASAKPETGMTTLLFERRPDGWKIVSDHSS